MSDITPKLSLRNGVNVPEKSASPTTKLMLSHGKPNFTINRSKSKTDSQCPFSPTNPETASIVLKSTANTSSNGYVKPSLMKIPLSAENEVSKVILRRTKLPEENGKTHLQPDEEPEFVKAQRRIAERLANQSNLDFESRKSGYFTHVMISPTSPTKQMELPVVADHKIEKASVVEVVSETVEPKSVEIKEKAVKNVEDTKESEPEASNGLDDTDKQIENGHENGDSSQLKEELKEEKPIEIVEAAKTMVEEVVQNATKEIPTMAEEVPKSNQNGHENGIENGCHNGNENAVADSDLNNKNHSQQQESDVNFEPKTVTSFAKELSGEPNKYPDTVKVVTEIPHPEQEFLKDMYKLKFDIHANSKDVEVIPTVRTAE